MNREAWLSALTERLRGEFEGHGLPLPATIRVSVGFPSRSALSKRKQRIGECWKPQNTVDGSSQIFISPVIGSGLRAAGVLVHELIHAALPKAGHKGPFKRAMKTLGLVGKPTATEEGPELVARLTAHLDILGPYPHAPLSIVGKDKTQTTRLLKVSCSVCGYVARVTQKWLDVGAPICPTNGVRMEEEE